MIVFLRWWLMFCLFGIGAAVMQKFGLFVDMWIIDASKLSFVILEFLQPQPVTLDISHIENGKTFQSKNPNSISAGLQLLN